MPSFEKSTRMPVSSDRLWEWHMRPGALDELVPPWQDVEIVERADPLEEGAEVVMVLGVGPFEVRWVAHHRDFVEGRQFVDEQREGPFATWVHTHRFEPDGPDGSILRDEIEYELPLGGAVNWLGAPFVRRMLDRMFEYRHRVTREALAETSTSDK